MKFLAMMVLGMSFLFSAVDINNANEKELMSIKGVGDKKASAIVEYRKGNCFKNVDEIVKVKGLGKKFLEKNRANLEAGTCKKK